MSKSEVRKNQGIGQFLLKAAIALLVVIALGSYVFERYRLGIDTQVVKCLPWTLFIVDTHNKEIRSGEYFAYRAFGMQPVIPDGQWAAKQAAAVAGDHVSISRKETLINGTPRKDGRLFNVSSLDLDYNDLTRELIVGEDEIFGMGTLPESYDSRYVGPMKKSQIIGRVYPIY